MGQLISIEYARMRRAERFEGHVLARLMYGRTWAIEVYRELKPAMPGITIAYVTQQLRRMERSGRVRSRLERSEKPDGLVRRYYELSDLRRR